MSPTDERTAERMAEWDALTRAPRPEEVWDSLTSFRLRAIAAARGEVVPVITAAQVINRDRHNPVIKLQDSAQPSPPLRFWRPCKTDTGLFHGPVLPAYLPRRGPFNLRGVAGTDWRQIHYESICPPAVVELIAEAVPREWLNTGDEHHIRGLQVLEGQIPRLNLLVEPVGQVDGVHARVAGVCGGLLPGGAYQEQSPFLACDHIVQEIRCHESRKLPPLKPI
jgi:hypothetical protein